VLLSEPTYLVTIFAWLFTAILGSALLVVRHADRLAMRLGEPYGTLILTLSVTVIEARQSGVWWLLVPCAHPLPPPWAGDVNVH
jgi:hypothetical protein